MITSLLRMCVPAGLFLALLLPQKGMAQNDVFVNNATLEDLLNTKVTTASQNQEKLSEAPATIFVLTAADIAERGYLRLDQLLEDLPEVEIQYKTTPTTNNWISMRGASGNGQFLILQDGIRINAPVGDRMAVIGNYSIANAERVEVIVGPGSALWGADAFGGVINIISKGAKEDAKPVMGKIQGAYGRFSTIDANGFLQAKAKKLVFSVNGSYTGSKEPYFPKFYPTEYTWYTDSFANAQNGAVRGFGSSVLHVPYQEWATPSSAYYIHAKLTRKAFEAGFVANGEMHSSSISYQAPYSLFVKEATYGTNIRNGYVKYRHQSKDERLTLLFQGAYTDYQVNPKSRYRNLFSNYQDAWKFANQHDVSVRAQGNYAFNRDHLVVAGATFQRTDITALTADLDTTYGAIPDSLQYYAGTTIPQDIYKFIQTNYGFFAQYQGIIAHTLRATMGVRFDHNSRYGSTLNPRVGLIYAPASSPFTAKILYGEAFRAPSPLETFQHFGSFPSNTPGDTAQYWYLPNDPNNPLRPEEMSVIEINTAYKLKKVVFDANIYYQELSHLIGSHFTGTEIFHGFTVLAVERPVNQGKLSAYGGTVKVTTVQKVGNVNLNIWSSYSYADGSSEENNYLRYMAKHTLKTGAVLTYKRFSVSPRLILRGQSFGKEIDAAGKPLQVAPAFALINLNARYHLWGENEQGGTIFLNIRNLTNAQYYNVSAQSTNYYLSAVPQDPFRISGGFSFSF